MNPARHPATLALITGLPYPLAAAGVGLGLLPRLPGRTPYELDTFGEHHVYSLPTWATVLAPCLENLVLLVAGVVGVALWTRVRRGHVGTAERVFLGLWVASVAGHCGVATLRVALRAETLSRADVPACVAALVLAALAAGALTASALRPQQAPVSPEPLPGLAGVDPGRAVWTGTASNTWPFALAAAGVTAGHLVAALLSGHWWLLLLALALDAGLTLLALATCVVRVSVTARGVRWRSPLGAGGQADAQEITQVRLVHVDPEEFGGYGLRRWPGRGRGVIVRRGPGIELTYAGRTQTITVDDAATGVALAQRLFRGVEAATTA